MRNLIRRILREENEKTPKSKLIKQLERPNGLITLLKGGLTIDDITNITEIPEKEIYRKFNPFRQIGEWFDDRFKEEVKIVLGMMLSQSNFWFIKKYKDKGEDEIIEHIISMTIDAVHSFLIDFDIEDWKIPNTPKLLQIIYTDWIKEQKEFKRLNHIIQHQ